MPINRKVTQNNEILRRCVSWAILSCIASTHKKPRCATFVTHYSAFGPGSPSRDCMGATVENNRGSIGSKSLSWTQLRSRLNYCKQALPWYSNLVEINATCAWRYGFVRDRIITGVERYRFWLIRPGIRHSFANHNRTGDNTGFFRLLSRFLNPGPCRLHSPENNHRTCWYCRRWPYNIPILRNMEDWVRRFRTR